MTNLSSLPGFGSGGGGGGAAYTDKPVLLDQQGYNLQDEGKYLNVTNMSSYFQTFRIRGMDTSSKAYFATNCMVQNGSGGNMQHCCTLFSANQSTGAITKEGTTIMHNNSANNYDYSTYTKTSDEWTGRYSYHGHIPHSGQSHTYSYHKCRINGVGSKDSDHSNSSYYPASNDQTHNSYVAPGERRLGGAVRHWLAMYDASSRGAALEFYYDYHVSSLNTSRNNNQAYSTSMTSTTYQVTMFQQWDSTNEPYYDGFMMQEDGLFAHRRSQDDWQNKGQSYGWTSNAYAFVLSNGNILYGVGNACWLIDTSGNFTSIPGSQIAAPMALARRSWAHFCWNVGEDEWLMSIPGGRFCKFKINPTNGYITVSNLLLSSNMELKVFDDKFQTNNGFYRYDTSANNGGYMATFGTENSNGYGYGQSKLMHVAGNDTPRQIQVATYDIADLVDELTYS